MVKLLLSVILEAVVGISLAGLILAVFVPLERRYAPDRAPDGLSAAVIIAVIVGAVAAVLFRPRSAINRWIRR
jgi:H+/Cl- antiporter ClcA